MVEDWLYDFFGCDVDVNQSDIFLATQAAQWGADQELESVKEEIINQKWFADPTNRICQLYNSRRPPRLSDRALSELAAAVAGGNITPERGEIIKDAIVKLQSKVSDLEALQLKTTQYDSPHVATDKQILEIWHSYNTVDAGLRHVYNLGRSHSSVQVDDSFNVASDSGLKRIWNKYSGDIIDPLREIYDFGRNVGMNPLR
jgi:hypothetical protein